MREAVSQGQVLGAPTVGRWRPAVGLGTPLSHGVLLGWLERVGRELAVRAPAHAAGVVVEVAPAGAWVAYGDPLVTWGEGALAHTAAPPTAAVAGGPEGAEAIRAEIDGTVYLQPEPGAPSFAGEGQEVDAHATVALIEVMKTFTPVRAPFAGTVVRVDVRSGDPVEEGAPLLWIRRA